VQLPVPAGLYHHVHIAQRLGSNSFGHLYLDRRTVVLGNIIDLTCILHVSKLHVYYDMHHYMYPKVRLHHLTLGNFSFSS